MAADIGTTLVSWSSTSGSNQPAGTTSVSSNLDDNLREIQGVVVRNLSHKGADIASAATTDLGAIEGLSHDITGTTTITSFGTVREGILKIVKFEGALILTHNATSLILPGGASIATADGDIGIFISEGSGNWRCVTYFAAAEGIGGFSTGDVKLTLKTVADTGWVLMNDTTIGNAASGATGRANADTVALFTLLWTNTADAQCAVSSGRGGSAAADYAANKTIALPKALGRALATYGAGSGLTSRALALTTGVETHPLTIAELAAHMHTGTSINGTSATAGTVSNNGNANSTPGGWTSDSTGSGTAHQNMQPTLFLNTAIKL